jgi:hypothetical protein
MAVVQRPELAMSQTFGRLRALSRVVRRHPAPHHTLLHEASGDEAQRPLQQPLGEHF